MIESNFSYDLLPNIDMKSYGEWVKKTVASIAKQPGMVEFHASRNILGAPQIRASTVWQSLEDWSRFAEENTWQTMQAELRGFATNIKVELWGPSPVLPEPVRPAK
ncbi:MAG TPA: hypothetical protein VJ577_04325 [Burkholderiaceae bacterium]|nr:hypothetical protein [Burkholderiaceae bacterium]